MTVPQNKVSVEWALTDIATDLRAIRTLTLANTEAISKLREELAALKVRAGIWGATSGILGTVGIWLINRFKL